MSVALRVDNCLAKESTATVSPLSAAWQIESKSCSSSVTQETKREASPPMDSPGVEVRVDSTIFTPPCLQELNFVLESLSQLGEGIGPLNFKLRISGFAGQVLHQRSPK